MKKISFILPLIGIINTISYADSNTNNLSINSISDLDRAIQQTLAQDDHYTTQATNYWFYINIYGGASYKAFPSAKQIITQPWGSDDIYQSSKQWSPYFAAKFGIRPFKYLSFAVSYWNAGSTKSQLDNDNGTVIQANGYSKMAFSGVDFYTTTHLPIPSVNSEILFSAGPTIVFSKFSPQTTLPNYQNPQLTKSSKINIRPFLAIEYQYQLPYAFTLGIEAKYIFGIGKNIYGPYYGSSYVPNMLNLSASLGYHF
ncbi:hypothetical protein [Fastidiosibacter lacustris]|uniref:hypothetical protein n=1 Tax=Fastidiosibacter lacustris TaxID=2056695 RepID=UPI000E3483DE|nr:hypothetical protein [Fastidiosibacter lacustris]